MGIILTAAGEEAQVDYGWGPMVRDPQSGKYRRTRLFVMTLGYSRKSVRLVWRSSSRVWAELHEQAFRRLGGCPRVVVLDNLREGVIVADIYDPTLNPLFRDVLAHYGVVALPRRIQDPDRKGKVESGVGHAQKTPLKGLRFESLEEAQLYLDRSEARWADTRIHGTTKRQLGSSCEDLFNKNGERRILKQVWNGKRFPLLDRLNAVHPYYFCRDVLVFSGSAVGIDADSLGGQTAGIATQLGPTF